MPDLPATLVVHTTEPLNAEPPLDALRRSFITPQELFYIRSHGPLPIIDPAQYRLRIGGRVSEPCEFTLDELRSRFAVHSVVAVVQCAGNRRAGMTPVRPVNGLPWGAGAIGNAIWTGIRLADVLHAVGFAAHTAQHVEFVSCDEFEHKGERCNYAVSIPISKALAPEVLLAWEMNGAELTPDHGFPLRTVVPGYAGVRSVKWLTEITVRETPSPNHMQQNDYKLFPASARVDTADWPQALTINSMPLTAAICEPQPHADLPAGPCTVRGYAIATGDAQVKRVDVSPDGGRTWQQAQLESHPESPWSWTLWQITLDLPVGEHELAARAWDQSGQTQPALPDDVWNFKGYLNVSWHRVPVRVH